MPKKRIIVSGLKPMSRLGRDAGWIGAPSAIDELSAKSVILTPPVTMRAPMVTDAFEGWMTAARRCKVLRRRMERHAARARLISGISILESLRHRLGCERSPIAAM